MKQIVLAFLLILCLASCQQKKRRKYVSVLKSQKSLINQWYGKDHFKENSELDDDASLNKNDKQDSFESDAGQIMINIPSTSTQTPVTQNSSTQAAPANSTSGSSTSESTSALSSEQAPSLELEENLDLTKVEEDQGQIDSTDDLKEALLENQSSE